MGRSTLTLLAAGVLAAAVAAPALSGGSDSARAPVTVKMGEFFVGPKVVTVHVGQTVRFVNGVVTWRKGRTRVVLDVDEADVVASIKTMKLRQFIRIIEQVDKQEMLLHPAAARTIPGVRIVDGEETFAVEI